MANRSSNTTAPGELVAWLGGLLMALVAGKDLRVRETIAQRGNARASTSRSGIQ